MARSGVGMNIDCPGVEQAGEGGQVAPNEPLAHRWDQRRAQAIKERMTPSVEYVTRQLRSPMGSTTYVTDA